MRIANTITVQCLFLCNIRSREDVIPIEVAKEETFLDLKIIMTKEKKVIANVDANNLKLWKVDIPVYELTDKLSALNANLNDGIKEILGGELMSLESKIYEAFPNEPSKECVHVIISQQTSDSERIEVALLVSQAIYEENPVQFLSQETVKCRHRFEKICVANENNVETPYLIAFSSPKLSGMKEVYIAFRGTWNSQNWVKNMSTLPHFTRNKGRLHSGFKKVAEQVPSDLLMNIIENDNIMRVTLCGHSHGGAVSHVYLLLYFIICFNEGFTLPKQLDIISIAFGSPFIANNEIRKWLRKQHTFAKCFWNFINMNDGIPQSLNLVNNFAGQNFPTKQIHDKIITFIETLGHVFPKTKAVENCADVLKHYEEFLRSPAVQEDMFELYQPYGLWIFCENDYEIIDASNQPDDIVEKLGGIQLTAKSIQGHSIDEYCTVLKAAFGFSNIKNVQRKYENDDIPVTESNRFYPIIESVKAELHESNKPRVVIHITGKNLNFLSESAIELNYFTSEGSHLEYLVPAKTSSKEVLMSSNTLIVEGFVTIDSKNINKCTLQVKSHFGANEPFQIKEADWNIKTLNQAEKFVNEAIEGLLHKAIQRCFVSCKNGSNVTKDLLDSIAKLECTVLNREKSSIKDAYMTCMDNFEICDGLLEIEKMTSSTCSDIIKEISSNMPIVDKSGIGTYLILSLIICSAIAGGYAAVIAGAIARGIALEAAFGIIGAIFFRKKFSIACEAQYRSIVKFFLEQLKPRDNTENADMCINSPFLTEEALVNKWVEFGYNDMETNNEIVENMPFRTDGEGFYKNANDDSKLKAVHRIRSIVRLHEVRKKLLEHAFVTAIGPQNAGKTTALVRLFPGIFKLPNSDTVKIGIGDHTRSPVTYEFEHISIVDFPGLNAVNEDESSAPNMNLPEKLRNSIHQSGVLASIILCIFKFEGSVTAGLKELVDLVEPYLGEVPVLLCLNQAVEKMKAPDGLVSKNAVDIWHNRMVNELGLSLESREKLEVKFTDFESKNSESTECGIWHTDNVMQWIRSNIRDQLSFIKKDEKIDDILQAATEVNN